MDDETEVIEVSSLSRPTSANEESSGGAGSTEPRPGGQKSATASADGTSCDYSSDGFVSHSAASDNSRSQRKEPLQVDSARSNAWSEAETTSTGSADRKPTRPTVADARTRPLRPPPATDSKSTDLTASKRNADDVTKSTSTLNLKTPNMSFPDVLMERTRDLDHSTHQLSVLRKLDPETRSGSYVSHDELSGFFWVRTNESSGGDLIPFSGHLNGGRFSNEKLNTPFVYMGLRFDSADQAFAYTIAKRAQLATAAEMVLKNPHNPSLWSEVHRLVDLHHPGFENSTKWNGSKTSRLYLRAILMCKFQQNPDLLRDLLSTGQAYLAEAVPDERWGCGISHDQWDHYANTLGVRPPNFPGKNWCGITTMEVRQYFRQLAKMYRAAYPDRPIPFAIQKSGRPTNTRVCVELPAAPRLTTRRGNYGDTIDDSEAGASIPSLFDVTNTTPAFRQMFNSERGSDTCLPSLFDPPTASAGHGRFASNSVVPDLSQRRSHGLLRESDASANAKVTETVAVASAYQKPIPLQSIGSQADVASSKSCDFEVSSKPNNQTPTSSVPKILMEGTYTFDNAYKQVRALRKYDKNFPYHHFDKLSEYFWSEACAYVGRDLIPFCWHFNNAAFSNMKTNTPFVYMGRRFNNAEQALSYICANRAGLHWIAGEVLRTPHDPSFCRTETARLLAMHAPGFTECGKWNGSLNSRMHLRAILMCKYQQNPDLLRQLLSTGHAYLAHVTADQRWGCGISHDQWHNYAHARDLSPTDFPGHNWCGITTMEVRQYFRHLAKMFHAAYPDRPFPFATDKNGRRTNTRVCVEFREAPVLDPVAEHQGTTPETKPDSCVPSLADQPNTSPDLGQHFDSSEQPPASVSAVEAPCDHSPRVFSPKESPEHLRDSRSNSSDSAASANDEVTEAVTVGSADQKPILSSTTSAVTGSDSEQGSEDITSTPTRDSESSEFQAVTAEKLGPSVVTHPTCPPSPLRIQTLAPAHAETSVPSPGTERPDPTSISCAPMDLESSPSPQPQDRASLSSIHVPTAAVSPVKAPPSSSVEVPTPDSSLSTAKKRKSRFCDRAAQLTLPPPGVTIMPSLSGTATAHGDTVSVPCDTGPPGKIPRLEDGVTDYELSLKTKILDAQKERLATTMAASQNVTDELLTLIGQFKSESLDDALKRLAECARHAETVSNCDCFTTHTKRLEALGLEAVELFERERCVFDPLAAEKADLRRKLQIYRNLSFQNPDSITDCSADELSAVARELRERIDQLRAVVLKRREGVREEHDSTNLHTILQSDVLRLAETENASRLSVPFICELFENEVAPRFELAQKLHSDMERRVLEATALLDARERRLSELG